MYKKGKQNEKNIKFSFCLPFFAFCALHYICIGMGGGWLICGILQLIRHIRYIKDKNYRENFDIETNDERNKYISSKAWSWAGYGFVLISGIASIVLLIANQRVFASVTSGSICLVITLYWISYLYLKRNY